MNSILSNKIKSGRTLRALSQQKLADEVGVSKQMISKYEKGLSVPSSKVLMKLAKTLRVSLDYFFTSAAVELGTINFRKRSRLSQRKLNSIKEEVRLKLSKFNQTRSYFNSSKMIL